MKISPVVIRQAIKDWVKNNEASDKFGDVVLYGQCKDITKLSLYIANRLNKELACKHPLGSGYSET